jgi:lipid II:glycine glycyltransferase (peptidoglycan interpeptide bridge formation enzyme)
MVQLITDISLIQESLPVLSTEAYLSTKSAFYGWFLSEKFILAFFLDKRFIFKRIVFTDNIIKRVENTTLTCQQKFLDEIVEYCIKEKLCDFISKAQSNVVFQTFPKNSISVPWGTHLVDINKNDTDLLNSFDGKHRNRVRKAIQEGVTVDTTNDVNLIYKIIKETLIRQKSIHYPSLKYLKNLQLLNSDNVLFFTSNINNEVQGVVVIVFDDHKGYAMYAGSIEKPSNGSLNLMHYEIMKSLRDHGCKIYDFVGTRINPIENSKQAGLYRFKTLFGASLQEGYAFRVVINEFKYKTFHQIIKFYCSLTNTEYTDPIDQILLDMNLSSQKNQKIGS